ncbi:hypothetical protein I6I99_04730 [Sphingobacterium multivorum]|uniref:Uncharacterized protein n=1 Tax=Sphingobacterium multivorum TaxID=28454 RepID=A0ABX7CKD2_SPHMU|nr:hypothetical protein [Sphingobacterium multivorum]QQT31875.1 hypothetical protein I6I99_04730 [Sphingobacterium multivorum]QQT52194.1 hypothetical protein I6I98_18195 [Sphingobacterium multivorum]
MKKLLMSLVALAALSSAAFAGTGAKAAKENAEVKTTTNIPTKAIAEVKATEEAKATNARLIRCVYVLNVYNTSGEVVATHTSETYVQNSCSGFFGSCKIMYRHMLANGDL